MAKKWYAYMMAVHFPSGAGDFKKLEVSLTKLQMVFHHVDNDSTKQSLFPALDPKKQLLCSRGERDIIKAQP
jgi:hypothetical protein